MLVNTRASTRIQKRLSCHDGCQEVSRCCTRGESEELALKHMADVTRSPKQGFQRPTKRTDVLQKLKKVHYYLLEKTWAPITSMDTSK